jgi:CubicO group peptidase (beta-lactamase class C family)
VIEPAALLAVVESGRQALGVPGLAAAITDRERTLWAGCHGLAEIAGARLVTAETLFQIGSISKSFAALAALQEAERGTIDLEAPVTEYLPWFRLRTGTEAVTLHGLLSHTAGLPAGMDPFPSTLGEVLVLARADAHQPGRFRYSNAGYAVVGLVLERVTGSPIADVLRRAVFEPARMGSTEAVMRNALRARSAVGYEPLDDSVPWQAALPLAPAPWVESDSAAGSISSTAEDMAAYARVLLNEGRGIVSAESFRRMTEAASGLDEHGYGYAYGLSVGAGPGRRWVGHSGTTPGFSAALDADLVSGIAVAVLTNRGDCGIFAPWAIAEALRCAASGLAEPRDPPQPLWPEPSAVAEPEVGEVPEPLRAYVGHYRSHSPWLPGFRVFVRDGQLALRLPGFAEVRLEQRHDGSFLVTDDVEGPSTVEFGDVIDGRAARATCDGADLYRVSWP